MCSTETSDCHGESFKCLKGTAGDYEKESNEQFSEEQDAIWRIYEKILAVICAACIAVVVFADIQVFPYGIYPDCI